MNIGYACLNSSIPYKMKTFRLKSYSDELIRETVANNIEYTRQALLFNIEHSINFFRVSSSIVPFASHPICTVDWQKIFADDFKQLGLLVKKHHLRISMHPDQFVVLNSKSENVVENAKKELLYHAHVLDLMKLDTTHKIQIHVGGVFGDKGESVKRFIKTYNMLPKSITSRLVIENDDRLFSLKDCLEINNKISIPILFDIFHHQCLNNGEDADKAFEQAAQTWQKKDGKPMMDYSSQEKGMRMGRHSESIDINDFKKYSENMKRYNFDVMLEVKDKEKSVLKAIEVL